MKMGGCLHQVANSHITTRPGPYVALTVAAHSQDGNRGGANGSTGDHGAIPGVLACLDAAAW